MINMKYSEIIKENKKLEQNKKPKYQIAILSNIMVHQSKDICEYSLRQNSINAEVALGDYDNIVQDSLKYQNAHSVLIFWELWNLIDGLQYKIESLSDDEFSAVIDKTKHEMDIVFHNLSNVSLVVVNKFSSLVFNHFSLKQNRIDILMNELNQYLATKKNIILIDIDKVIASISIEKSIDLRYYNSSKTLYSIEFYKKYFDYIKPIFLSANGKVKKALIFDCDNTLWKGILGEDGFEKIKMYKEIQYLAIQLSKKGVIIGLCSKNNPQDVDEVLEKHPKMILRDENIVIKKVNWEDKATNLKSIAKELNIGLDSIVFIDDSDFEVNLIKEELPMIEVFQVPNKEYEYAMMIRDILNLFYNPKETKEDLEKVKMYKTQIKRAKEEENITDIEEYLKGLGLNITYFIDDISQADRISQMTQKTNQFNLTTKRYTKIDIETFINNKNMSVISISVNDKFGDSGIVGLAILEFKNDLAIIDTFLMSCRVLGRNIEYRFMDIIFDILKDKSISKVNSVYIKTLKNDQVSDLYDRYGFEVLEKDENLTKYRMLVKNYKDKNLNYIGVKNGK
ncbi:HAD-IIIC family phosphatase [Aliarcobacter skirrowii]|uniref:HAD-IIIC family phosphatase n=1 Tax=Aliarcobacter skirrowii TaxID=28200 RepID=UPI0029BE3CA0|nr:HAD-IIIC family phosphatase [Aliarcobacter skirrowii]MDX4048456.1 HAD-IIIC family phosphatase [Aliarcobacter skirrowii]